VTERTQKLGPLVLVLPHAGSTFAPMPPPPGPPPGIGGALPPATGAKALGGGAMPKPATAPDWRKKLPAANAGSTVMQVPAVSSTGRTQWQPSSSFVPPAEPEPEPEPEPETSAVATGGAAAAAEEEDSDESDDMFAAFANNYHAQVKQVTPEVSPEKDAAAVEPSAAEPEHDSDSAQAAAAAARDERAAALLGEAAAGSAPGVQADEAVQDAEGKGEEEQEEQSAPAEMSEEDAKKLAEAEAAATARAVAEDDEEEAAAEAADALDTPVSLGFAENCDDFPHELEPEYFPSKIGGQPAWLHPLGIPVDKNRCPHCAAPLSFLLQIYTGGPGRAFPQPGAFHRTLFLFTCRSSACHARKPPVSKNKNKNKNKNRLPSFIARAVSLVNTSVRDHSRPLARLVFVACRPAVRRLPLPLLLACCRTQRRSACGAHSSPSTTDTTPQSRQSTACTGRPSRSKSSQARKRQQQREQQQEEQEEEEEPTVPPAPLLLPAAAAACAAAATAPFCTPGSHPAPACRLFYAAIVLCCAV
jgi:hypothetical protein